MHTIGFLGLGNMGLPMALNLQRAGHALQVFDTHGGARDAARDAGLHPVDSLIDALRGADIVMTMLPDGAAVLSVLEQMCQHAAPCVSIVDCSTIDIADARHAHRQANDAGFGWLDAPVSGGVAGATAGTLTMMVGGDAMLLERLRPVLSAVSAQVVHCGGGGAGQAAKICNNMLLAASMIATGEAFALAAKLELDPQVLFEVLSTSTGSCWSVNRYCPVPGVGPESPADNDFRPGFPAQLMLKDLSLTQAAADDAGQATPLGARSLELYQDLVDGGAGARDFSVIIEYLRNVKRLP